ncbi:hypothetical protein BWI97_07340 [Siphonobacter sp. BAB-5405]|nr:hypothetical protein BWI97_07340 [Siphonobacter sp. BAB-5405]
MNVEWIQYRRADGIDCWRLIQYQEESRMDGISKHYKVILAGIDKRSDTWYQAHLSDGQTCPFKNYGSAFFWIVKSCKTLSAG